MIMLRFWFSQQKGVPKLLKIGTKFTQKLRFQSADNLTYQNLYPLNNGTQSKVINPMLIASLFSRLIGSNLHGSIYLGQTLNWHKQALLEKEISCEVEIVEDLGRNRYLLRTEVNDDEGKILSGEAKIMQM